MNHDYKASRSTCVLVHSPTGPLESHSCLVGPEDRENVIRTPAPDSQNPQLVLILHERIEMPANQSTRCHLNSPLAISDGHHDILGLGAFPQRTQRNDHPVPFIGICTSGSLEQRWGEEM